MEHSQFFNWQRCLYKDAQIKSMKMMFTKVKFIASARIAKKMLRVLLLAFFIIEALPVSAQKYDQIIKAAAADRGAFDFTNRQAGDYFGRAVAVSGNYAVVGAHGEDEDENGQNTIDDAGAVYLYQKDPVSGNWRQVQKLVAADRETNDWAGFSVAISGDVAVVGAYFNGNGGTSRGAAYVFRNDGFGFWNQEQKLTPTDADDFDWFGYTVAISGDYIVVGAHKESENAVGSNTLAEAGSAYIFAYDGSGSWEQQQKIVANDRAIGDWFGFSVSISGNIIVVGARHEDENEAGGAPLANAGSAYIYRRTGINWVQVQKIVASDRAAGYHFGYSVAIDGNYAVIGAFDDLPGATDMGAAYVFFFNGTAWGEQQKLTPADGAATDWFGISVSISGNKMVIGAQQEDENASGGNTLSNAGSAYVFQRIGNNWAQAQKIVAADRAEGDLFGCSVAISGNTILTGAYFEDEDINGANTHAEAGAVYFNTFNGNWNQQQKQVPGIPSLFNQLGYYADVRGDYAIVGAVTDDLDANGTNALKEAGSAYIYKKDPQTGLWQQQQKIVPSDRAAEAWFGYTVAIQNEYAVVTALFEERDAAGNNLIDSAGAAYVFKRTGNSWNQVQKIVAPDRLNPDAWFGSSVALDNGTLVIGACQESRDAAGSNSVNQAGAAYVYTLDAGSGLFVFQQKLIAAVRAPFDRMGFSVGISGNFVISGAYLQRTDALGGNSIPGAGAAYVFNRVGNVWTEQAKLLPSDRALNDNFGFNVDIDADRAIVSSFSNLDANGLNNINDAGAAYVFKRNGTTWAQEQKLVSPERDENDNFGYCVHLSGNRLVASAPGESEGALAGSFVEGAGAAYMYERNLTTGNWQLVHKLVAGDRTDAAYAQFGYSVALDSNDVVIGAVGEMRDADAANPVYSAGAAYFYRRSPNPYFSNGDPAANSLTAWNSQRNNLGNLAYDFSQASGWVIESGDTLTLTNGQNLVLSADSLVTELDAGLMLDGTLQIGNTPFFANGTLGGNGTLDLNNAYTNNGIVAPGSSAGRLNVVGSFNNSIGALNIEIGGTAPATDHDVLAITGSATLSGTLNVSLLNGFTPIAGQTFTVVTAAAVTGTFTTVNWPVGNVGTVIYNPTNVVITFPGVLPLRLLVFNGFWQNDHTALLQWQTDQEENMEGFDLQWSPNGINFTTIYTTTARNMLNVQNYQYVHTQAGALNFYRLAIKDRNGKITMSQIVRLSKAKEDKLMVYPNPAQNQVQVTLPQNGLANLRIINSKGQTVIQKQLIYRNSFVQLGTLPAGTYWVWIEQSGKRYTEKLNKY
jgi:FG-GAP repeat/Secretion system C-terminal sorting domain